MINLILLRKICFCIIFFVVCVFQSFSQGTLIGNWHRVIPGVNNHDLKSKNIRTGDLQIFEDSTFHIQGDTIIQNSTPGWHVGQDHKGKMEMRGSNYFVLWVDSNDKIFLAYKIVQLTKEKLIVKLANSGSNITYVRF